jgi:hypothetical protein
MQPPGIQRKLVERMGGRVGVESEEGKGSRFWLSFVAGDAPQRPNLGREDESGLSAAGLRAGRGG